MTKLKHGKIILGILIVLLVAVNYNFVDEALQNWLVDYETGFVERVIDGDTIKINGSSYRLLGINTPEKGEKYSEEAKMFLESQILNSTVKLYYTAQRKDRYQRDLVYVFSGKRNINAEIVEQGFANTYYPSGKDIYYSELSSAWETCLKNNVNLCESSLDSCFGCINLVDLNVKNQFVLLNNTCSFSCELTDWSIKDEGRKNYIFGQTILNPSESVKITASDFDKDYVWTSSGDTLFLRDNEGRLVLWESY